MIIGTLLLSACNQKDKSFKVVSDKDLTLQIMQMPLTSSNDSGRSIKIRLIPSANVEKDLTPAIRDSIMLNTADLFTISRSGEAAMTVFVQSVPNGIKGTYEFLVDLDGTHVRGSDTIVIAYRDHFINKKKYQITTVLQ